MFVVGERINLNEVKLTDAELMSVMNELRSTKARTYNCDFITAGAVGYPEQNEIHYVTEDALERMAKSFIGRPVVVGHDLDITRENLKNKAKGYVTNCYKNPMASENTWSAEFIIFDEDTINKIDNEGYNYVSCAYWRENVETDVVINDVKYNKVINDGFYLHLAITKNPRYTDSKISANEKSAQQVGILEGVSFNEKGETEVFGFKKEKVSINTDVMFETVDGLKSVEELVASYNETHTPAEEPSKEEEVTEAVVEEAVVEETPVEEKPVEEVAKESSEEEKPAEEEVKEVKTEETVIEKLDESSVNESLSAGQYSIPATETKVIDHGPVTINDRLALGKQLY